jgi:hypothetical protein
MKTTLRNKVSIVLGLPRAVAALIVRLTAILGAMTANKTTFNSPPIAIATVVTHVAALAAAEAATKTKAAGTKQTRDDALTLVIEDAKQLHAYVQQLANASPNQALTIAEKAAMTLRKVGAHPVHDLTIKQGSTGTVHVSARSVKGARAHEWQYSTDGGKSWTIMSATTTARTIITGLQPGVLVEVKHRSVVKGAPANWSAPFQAAVS